MSFFSSSSVLSVAMTAESEQRAAAHKIAWSGNVLGIQPRIDLGRSFDQRQHSYLGYVLFLRGEAGEFSVRIGPGAQAKHAFRAGDRVSGAAHPVADREREPAELYKASALKLAGRAAGEAAPGPPWRGVPPALEVYRARGHRRLAEIDSGTAELIDREELRRRMRARISRS